MWRQCFLKRPTSGSWRLVKQKTNSGTCQQNLPWNPLMHDRRSASYYKCKQPQMRVTRLKSCQALSFRTWLRFRTRTCRFHRAWMDFTSNGENLGNNADSDRFCSGSKQGTICLWLQTVLHVHRIIGFISVSIMWISRLFLRLVLQNESVHLVENGFPMCLHQGNSSVKSSTWATTADCHPASGPAKWQVDRLTSRQDARKKGWIGWMTKACDKGVDSLKTDWMPIPIGTCMKLLPDLGVSAWKEMQMEVFQSVQRWTHVAVNTQMIVFGLDA